MKYETISYGKFDKLITNFQYKIQGKLIVITSISPTANGEGKTTTLIGLTDLFNFKKQNAMGCLRQPSIGPFLGMKGGATGSGQCCLQNDFEINIGLTSDFEKIALVNNLIVSILENEIYFNSHLNVDPKQILMKRCLDLNDRGLRNINYPINKEVQINSGFEITAASNLMAAFCLVNDPNEFSKIIDQTIVAFSKTNQPIRISDLKLTKTIDKILQQAFLPNIVKTKYENSILMHGGPFANIAHGCNSIIATKIGLSMADFVFSECGFGSDLGLEKFINIKCRRANLKPNLIVYAISLKSIIEHGNGDIEKGIEHLKQHLKIGRSFGLEPIVILNQFANDQPNDLNQFLQACQANHIKAFVSNLWSTGPNDENASALYDFVLNNIEQSPQINYTYELSDSIEVKIEKVATKIYGAQKIVISENVIDTIKRLENGEQQFNICIAKDQKSIIGHNLNDHSFKISEIKINYAAKLIVLIASQVFLMPGLPKIPNAMGDL